MQLQLLAILHIDFFFQILFSNGFDYLTSSCKVYNIFKFNLSLQSSTFWYFIIIIIIIIIIITTHLYSLLVFVINIVVLCLVSFQI